LGLIFIKPISTTLAAIALVKSGFEHASDLKDIAGSLGMQSNRLIE
jgi:hypothetical protein|tara:strand:+ start:669 stop:806 length:138 start_codon:yes stop_codon:yes gene_type:complete